MSVRLMLHLLRASAPLLFLTAVSGKPILPATIFGDFTPTTRLEAADPEAPIAEAQFNTLPNPLPPNLASLGYHITGTAEFGDLVRLNGSAHFVESISVTMSSWAIRSDYPGSSAFGFTHPITVKIYEVDQRSGQPRPGPLLGRATAPFLIPWRPEPDPTAPASPLRPWRGPDGNYYGGVAFNITFDLSGLALALPDDVIVSVSFNTQQHGEAPLGKEGPYNSLNVGLTSAPPAVGSDLGPGAVYWKTAGGSFYSDQGAAGVNVLRLDPGWGAYTAAIRVNNSPFGTLADVATRLTDLHPRDPVATEAVAQARKLVTAALDRSLWQNNRQLQIAWGPLVFDLLSETVGELMNLADSRDAAAAVAHRAIDSLLTVGQALADGAMGEAAMGGGNFSGLVRAEDALEAAATARAMARPDVSIDELANAWREAQLSLR